MQKRLMDFEYISPTKVLFVIGIISGIFTLLALIIASNVDCGEYKEQSACGIYYKDNLNVNFLDIRKKLLNNKDKYLFFRTDHHWTTFGSYYAYEDYCSKNNLKIYPTKYKLVSKDFQGTIYSKLLDNSIKKDYIYY